LVFFQWETIQRWGAKGKPPSREKKGDFLPRKTNVEPKAMARGKGARAGGGVSGSELIADGGERFRFFFPYHFRAFIGLPGRSRGRKKIFRVLFPQGGNSAGSAFGGPPHFCCCRRGVIGGFFGFGGGGIVAVEDSSGQRRGFLAAGFTENLETTFGVGRSGFPPVLAGAVPRQKRLNWGGGNLLFSNSWHPRGGGRSGGLGRGGENRRIFFGPWARLGPIKKGGPRGPAIEKQGGAFLGPADHFPMSGGPGGWQKKRGGVWLRPLFFSQKGPNLRNGLFV